MIASIKSWLTQPFANSLSVWNYFLIIGLILVLIVLWSRIINMLVGITHTVSESV